MRDVIILIIFLFALFFMFGAMHEKVHQEIYESYGIESEINYFSDFPSMTTVPEEPCQTEGCNFAHNLNEIIGYPLIVIFALIGIGIFVILIKMVKIQEILRYLPLRNSVN